MSILNPTIVQATSNTVTVVLNPQLNQVSVVQPQNGATVVRDSVIRGPSGPQGPQGIPGLNDWIVITSDYNAQNRDRLIANTSNGSFTITLPDPPNVGDYMQITDGNNWGQHVLHIDPQSATIEGFSGVMNVDVQGITIELIHDESTWQVTATLGRNGEPGPTGPSGLTGPQGPQGPGADDAYAQANAAYEQANAAYAAANSGGGGGLPLANGSSNFDIAVADGNATITANSSYTWTFNDLGLLTVPGPIMGDGLNLYGESATESYAFITIPNNTNSATTPIHIGNDNGNVNISTIDQGTSTAYHWTFDNTGAINLPGAVNFHQNLYIPLGKPAVNGANDRITLWDFEGSGSGFNYGIGVEPNHVWFTMDVNNGEGGFKFYSRDSERFKIKDDGAIHFLNNSQIIGNGDYSVAGTIELVPNYPAGYGMGQYLVIRPTTVFDANHIHIEKGGPSTDLFLGNDDQYVKVANTGDVEIKANNGTSEGHWNFNTDGKIEFPLLYSDRGDTSSGTVYGNTLKFANSSYQAIIAGPEGTDTNPSAERMVIEGGKGYTGTGGEGGDIYLWAGRGGDAGGTGGDIKVRGGYGYSEGGYIRIDGGDTAAGPGGYVEITGGSSATDHGGDIRLVSGYGANGYGNVSITSASSNWRFNNDGNTIFPNTAQQTIHLGARSSIKYLDDQIIQQSGNAAPDTFYTITNQEDSFWETYTQKDVTGGNSAWSWIQSETADANNPYVLIETKKLDENPTTWTFSNGTIQFPNNSTIIDMADDGQTRGVYLNVNSNIFQFDTGGRSHWPNDILINYGGLKFNYDNGFSGLVPYFGWVLTDSETLKLQTNVGGGDLNTDIAIVDRQSQSVTFNSNIIANTGGFPVGYRDIPQISFVGDATLALGDSGKHYYSTISTANTLTVPDNATVAFPIGATINFVNQGSANVTIANAAGVTLYLAGSSTAGSRNVISYGVATLQKVAVDTWFLFGTGVS